MEEKMKLLKHIACLWTLCGGNVKAKTVMGDTWMDRLSDAGSIPASSTRKKAWKIVAKQRFSGLFIA